MNEFLGQRTIMPVENGVVCKPVDRGLIMPRESHAEGNSLILMASDGSGEQKHARSIPLFSRGTSSKYL